MYSVHVRKFPLTRPPAATHTTAGPPARRVPPRSECLVVQIAEKCDHPLRGAGAPNQKSHGRRRWGHPVIINLQRRLTHQGHQLPPGLRLVHVVVPDLGIGLGIVVERVDQWAPLDPVPRLDFVDARVGPFDPCVSGHGAWGGVAVFHPAGVLGEHDGFPQGKGEAGAGLPAALFNFV